MILTVHALGGGLFLFYRAFLLSDHRRAFRKESFCAHCYVQISVIWCGNNHIEREIGDMEEKLMRLMVEQYGLGRSETIVAAAVKAYLVSLPEWDALEKLDGVIRPKVIQLYHESGVPLPLQSVVEGAKLAAFIDEAVEYAVSVITQESILTGVAIDALSGIKGKVIIGNASSDFLQFIADCYRFLKY